MDESEKPLVPDAVSPATLADQIFENLPWENHPQLGKGFYATPENMEKVFAAREAYTRARKHEYERQQQEYEAKRHRDQLVAYHRKLIADTPMPGLPVQGASIGRPLPSERGLQWLVDLVEGRTGPAPGFTKTQWYLQSQCPDRNEVYYFDRNCSCGGNCGRHQRCDKP